MCGSACVCVYVCVRVCECTIFLNYDGKKLWTLKYRLIYENKGGMWPRLEGHSLT